MDNATILKAVSGIIVTAVLFVLPQAGFAEDSVTFCAAVMACDDQGQILREYAEGECGEMYAKQCAQSQVNRLNEKLYSCYDDSSSQEMRFKRKIKRLRKALRKAKSN